MRNAKNNILLFLKGMGMGGADVVPGVSGGTIAFITGIYEELLNSIKSFDQGAIQLLFRGKIAAFWKHVNANFLIVLFGGIAISGQANLLPTKQSCNSALVVFLWLNHHISLACIKGDQTMENHGCCFGNCRYRNCLFCNSSNTGHNT